MKKLHNTDIKEFYTVVDNNNGHSMDFEDINDLVWYANTYCRQNHDVNFSEVVTLTKKSILVTAKWFEYFNPEYTDWKSSYSWKMKTIRNFYVMDSCGDLVDLSPKKIDWVAYHKNRRQNQHRTHTENINDMIRASLTPCGENVNQIKSSYVTYERFYNYCNEYAHSFHKLKHHRAVRTIAARRSAANVIVDEDEPKFRASRSGYNLPSSYDDVSVGVYYNFKSWKHNSKRRKQWKPKPHLIEVGS